MGVEAVVGLIIGTVVVLLVPALVLSLSSSDRLHSLQSRFQKH
jgi:hypothetical protein